MWLRKDGVRPASRSEDRMAVIEMKRKRATRKSLLKREVATVKLGIHVLSWLSGAGQRRAVNGRRVRWIMSGKARCSE